MSVEIYNLMGSTSLFFLDLLRIGTGAPSENASSDGAPESLGVIILALLVLLVVRWSVLKYKNR